jgi:hypothetical protein
MTPLFEKIEYMEFIQVVNYLDSLEELSDIDNKDRIVSQMLGVPVKSHFSLFRPFLPEQGYSHWRSSNQERIARELFHWTGKRDGFLIHFDW